MPRVLITGAFGYVGLALLRGLRSFERVGLGHAPRNPAARRTVPPDVEAVEGDLDRAPEILRDRGPFDAVVHLAGGGGAAKLAADPIEAVRANIRATTGLAEAAVKAGVRRRVFASTIAVYGTHRDHGRPYLESDAPRPDDIYGAVKEAAEHAWVALSGGIALRIANVYGTGAGVDVGLSGAVERFARASASGAELSVFGTGAQKIDYVHIDDLVRAVERALVVGVAPPVVNVGGGAPISILELAEKCVRAGEALGRFPKITRLAAPDAKIWPDRSLGIQLASETLDWRPQVSHERGITELVEMMSTASMASEDPR